MAKQDAGALAKFTRRKTEGGGPLPLVPTKGTGEKTAITVRFGREDWERLSEYARKQRVSMQALIEYGCSRILEDEGLKPLKAVVARNRDAKAA